MIKLQIAVNQCVATLPKTKTDAAYFSSLKHLHIYKKAERFSLGFGIYQRLVAA